MEVLAHKPVLLDEALEALAIRPRGLYLDGTFGRGGHARAILERLGPDGRLLAVDKDPEAVRVGRELSAADHRFDIERGSFAMLGALVTQRGWTGRIEGILLDLGVSSPQLDDAARGFSFRQEGPLDMRMDPDSGLSVADWLAEASEQAIAQVLREYGEERFAKRIARALVRERERAGPIRTTGRLAALIAAAVPARERSAGIKKGRAKRARRGGPTEGRGQKGKDPATRSFQALRIFINRELEELDAFLPQVPDMLAPGGRLAIISFHSLEDRRVKRFIREQQRGDEFPPDMPVTSDRLSPRLRKIGGAIRAGDEELQTNPRARSAVLRVAERL
jgi:16S rRNA (cytosine1402-N4)-methyltransferase